ncbi:MAG: hypothetical protein K5819_03625 [Lachnospiraceae bacterium]|nr:hypothetical protein [Lachnospiraceae bacterium]
MMDDLKLVWKVMTCSAYKKLGLTISIIAVALIVWNVCNRGSMTEMNVMPGVFAMIIVSWIPQSLLSVDLTHMMAASSKRKRLYVRILPAINAVAIILSFTLSIWIYHMEVQLPRTSIAIGILLTGVFALESQIFLAFVYKRNYWVCMIVFFVAAYATLLFVLLGGATRMLDRWQIFHFIKGEQGVCFSILAGYGCVLLGAVLYKVMTCVNYSRETQERSFRGMGGKDPRI